MAASKLLVYPAFYRRVRYYRDRISDHDGRPKVGADFVKATQKLVEQLLENPRRGHSAGFEAPELGDILRASVPGFQVFALFYRWDGTMLTIITVEHTAQDLSSKVADMLNRQSE